MSRIVTRQIKVRGGLNKFKLVDESGKELGRLEGLYDISAKILTLKPITVKSLIALEVG
jgi:hypothetical protein